MASIDESSQLVPALSRGKEALSRLQEELGVEGIALLLSQHRLVPNTGDGNCFLHALLHAVGGMGLDTQVAPRGVISAWRTALCDVAMRTVTCGRFGTLAEYDTLPRAAQDALQQSEEQLAPAELQLMERRSLYFDVDSLSATAGRPATRRSAKLSIFGRAAAAIGAYQGNQRPLPCSWWALVTELLPCEIILCSPQHDGAPAPYDAGMGEGATWSSGARERNTRLFVMYYADGYPDRPLTAAVKGNHFALLLPEGEAAPPLPGFATMQAVAERTGALLALRQPQQSGAALHGAGGQLGGGEELKAESQQSADELHRGSRQSGTEEQGDADEQSSAEGQSGAQGQSGAGEQGGARERSSGSGGAGTLDCSLCGERVRLAPVQPGHSVNAHVKRSHLPVDRQGMESMVLDMQSQVQAQGASAPPALARWAKAVRVCEGCCLTHTAQVRVCVSCRSGSGVRAMSRTTAARGRGSAGGRGTGTVRSRAGGRGAAGRAVVPPASEGSAAGSAGGAGGASGAGGARGAPNPYSREARSSAAGALAPPPVPAALQWTQNTDSVAQLLDSVTEGELVAVSFHTTCWELTSARQRKQWSALMGHVTGLVAAALDDRREAARAAANGAGIAVAARALLAAQRAWKLLHLLPVLAFGQQQEGKAVGQAERLMLLINGSFGTMLQSVLSRYVPSHQQQQRERQQQRAQRGAAAPVSDAGMGWSEGDRRMHAAALRLAPQRGGVGQAAKLLEGREHHAPADERTQATLRSKHPAAGTRAGVTDTAAGLVQQAALAARARAAECAAAGGAAHAPLLIEAVHVLDGLSRASAGKSAGGDGCRYEHLWAALGEFRSASAAAAADADFSDTRSPPEFVTHLAKIFTALLTEPELLPAESWRLLRAANLSGIGEKRRPIACATVLRRLMSSIVARRASAQIGPVLMSYSQLGVGVSSGVEHVATSARVWQENHGMVLQVDCTNAFNGVDRAAMVDGLERFYPQLLPLFSAVYCGSMMPEMRSELRQADGAAEDAVYITLSELGCQQGDPLGPLLFSVALTHALHPELEEAAEAEGQEGTAQRSSSSAVPRHKAYLDDLNLLLAPVFDEAAACSAKAVRGTLAAIGLEWNMTKSLASAQRGRCFSARERELLAELAIPWVDASTPEPQQGFITVGVPVGTASFVVSTIQAKLMDAGLWRMGWQLAGLAQLSTQAALLVFRGSFIRRFGYVARNVDPAVCAPVLGAYDTLCAWVLERILHLAGTCGAEEMQQLLAASLMGGAAAAAGADEHLVLTTLGPVGLETLPLQMARLSSRDGGLGLPTLSRTGVAAYIAQLHVTLQDAVLQSCEGAPGPPAGFSAFPIVRAYREACSSVLQQIGDADRATLCKPGHYTVWHWAADSDAAGDDEAAFVAVLAEPVQDAEEREGDEEGTTAPTNQFSAAGSPSDSAAQRRTTWLKALQKRLTGFITAPSLTQLSHDLLQPAHGRTGRAFRAQLRSQSGKDAMAWLGYAGLVAGMSSQDTNTMVLVSLGLEPWGLSGVGCPYCKAPESTPTTAHAMVCTRQHLVGHNALHTCMKRCLQFDVLRRNGITSVNEDSSMFTDPPAQRLEVNDRRGRLQADTAIQVGGLSLCGDDSRARKGFMLDTSVAGVTSERYIYGAAREPGVNSAEQDGYAAAFREAEKHRHHSGRFNARTWEFVPMVQETSGRFGRELSGFLEAMAMHCAQRAGGSKGRIRLKKAAVLRHARTTMSTALAMKTAERVTAFMRGADVLGRTVSPISSLLNLSRDL